jgi:Rad3-related DNA helicase
LDRNGIIASVSYERARMVMETSRHRHSGLLISHDSRSTEKVVRFFKESDKPHVLVSPAMVEGFDFPDDQCRYIIILKLPFADGRDPVERARRKSDKDWPNYNTCLKVIQTCGRGMRSEEDWCEIFVLDSHFGWFRKSVEWPKWFQRMMRYSEVVPKPLEFD